MEIDFVLTNSADPDEMPRSEAFHLGLHGCKSIRLGVSSLERFKLFSFMCNKLPCEKFCLPGFDLMRLNP